MNDTVLLLLLHPGVPTVIFYTSSFSNDQKRLRFARDVEPYVQYVCRVFQFALCCYVVSFGRIGWVRAH